MEDKMFNLMEKLYTEFQGMKTHMTNMETQMTGMKTQMTNMETRMQHGFVRLENKMDSNDKALFDGYKQNSEAIAEIRDKVDKLTEKVENQEIRLQVLKAAE